MYWHLVEVAIGSTQPAAATNSNKQQVGAQHPNQITIYSHQARQNAIVKVNESNLFHAARDRERARGKQREREKERTGVQSLYKKGKQG